MAAYGMRCSLHCPFLLFTAYRTTDTDFVLDVHETDNRYRERHETFWKNDNEKIRANSSRARPCPT